MTLATNISAMTFSHIIVNTLAFFSIAFFVDHYGPSVYALIAFYIAFQAWLVTFDLGFTPALVRSLSPKLSSICYSDKILEIKREAAVYRFFFCIISVAILIISGGIFAVSGTFERFTPDDGLQIALLLPLIASLRFYTTVEKAFYRASESFLILASLNIFFAFLRYVAIFFVIENSKNVIHFFYFQALVSFFELLIYFSLHQKIPRSSIWIAKNDLVVLTKNLRFILYSAFAGLAWLSVISIDKIFLFGAIPDANYSGYTILVQLASLALLVFAPLTGVLQPRVASLRETSGFDAVSRFLLRCNQFVVPLLGAILITLYTVFSAVFNIWANQDLDSGYEVVFLFFLMGYGLCVQGLVSYLLQFSASNMKIHGLAHVSVAVIYTPVVAGLAMSGNIFAISVAWLVAATLISQVAGFIAAKRIISVRYARYLYLPSWMVFVLAVIVSWWYPAEWFPQNGSVLINTNQIEANLNSLLFLGLTSVIFFLVASYFLRQVEKHYIATNLFISSPNDKVFKGH
jgi:O-antigen/teichoic acid export membrane protein